MVTFGMGFDGLKRAALFLAAFSLIAKLTIAPALLQAVPVPSGKALFVLCGGGQVSYVLVDLVGGDDPIEITEPGEDDIAEGSDCPFAAKKLDFWPPQLAGLVTSPGPARIAGVPSSLRLSDGGPRGPPPARGPPYLA